MSAWDLLIGQSGVVAELDRAASAAHTDPGGRHSGAMTHAWLVTGPPGSGRSNAAIAFAMALMCPEGGCGECVDCRSVARRSHVDVEIIRPEGLSYRTGETRELVRRASIAPARGGWHVMIIEDADRLTESANNVLLKAIEEPPPHTVWVLCAPSTEDVLPTIRSRCRVVRLRTPDAAAVTAALIERDEVDPAMAAFAARAAQGHIGRARALATDEGARIRRQEILRIPTQSEDLASCFAAAANVLEAATEDAKSQTDPQDEKERSNLLRAYGEGGEGKGISRTPRGAKGAVKELEDRQTSRRTRTVRDSLDRALIDLLSFYRDVLVMQTGAEVGLVNDEMRTQLVQVASRSTPESTRRRIDVVSDARLALHANVAPLLALEALVVGLRSEQRS
ncbi:MAG: DNA polymerase III subunit delta' [Actinomycetes bacterium]